MNCFEGRDGEWVEHHDLHDMLLFFQGFTPWKISMEQKKMEVWFRWVFLFKGMSFRFQPLIIWGLKT